MKETSLSFCSFDSTCWLLMVRLAKGTTTTQPAFNILSKWRWSFVSLLLSSQRLLVLLSLGTTSVDCVRCLSSKCRACDAWRKCHMAAFLLFLRKFFIACFVAVLNVLVAGDLRHEYAQSAWGFLFRGPPGCCVCCACIVAIDAPLTMIVIVGWVLSWYSQRSHDAFVTFVGKAALWLCHSSPRCIRRTLVLWALWCFTMMALIASIAISDGFNHAHRNWWWCRCLLLLVTTVPSYDTCVVFTARSFNSLITIQTELSFY